MSTIQNVSRRSFLKGVGLTGGGLVLGATIPNVSPLFAAESSDHTLNLFVSIQESGVVNIVCHRSEMGQGVRTGIPQIVADELEADWQQVHVVQGLANSEYGSQNTDGSRSIRRFYTTMRQMGAMAKNMLEQAAAEVWQVPVSEVYAKQHKVHHKGSGKMLGYGELAAVATGVKAPTLEQLKLKDKSDFNLIGKDVTIVDMQDIVTGNTTFGHDVQLPDMLIASIVRPPVVGANVKSVDKTEAEKVKGVVDIITMPERQFPVGFASLPGVAVLATNTWAAQQAAKKLKIEWTEHANQSHNSDEYLAELQTRIKAKGTVKRTAGDAYDAIAKADKKVSAQYTVPYLVHAPMEPPAATAVVTEDGIEIWACTQTPQSTQGTVAQMLGVDASKVKVNVTLLGGGFGRKSKPDYSVEAAILAKQAGKPVKVLWSREDDIRHGYYHAISAQQFEAGLDANGRVAGWIQRTAFPSISWTFNGTTDEPGDFELSLGFGDLPFALDNLSCETHKATAHARIGWVRSVSNIHHAFAIGSFVDEVAIAADQPAYETWMTLLGEDRHVDPRKQGFEFSNYGDPYETFPIDTARLKNVLKKVTDESGANNATADNEGWGISVHRSFVSYVAVAIKVRLEKNKIQVLEVHSAIDCGTVVNPDRVRSQQEGSMIFGLSLAMLGEISFKDGAVQQSNYHDYQVLRMNQCPEIKSYIIDSDAPAGGVGEPGTPPVAAALANAIARAGGPRIRDLPVNKHLQV
ncbi:MAG: molybdopterin cofactor-binding domain-containing protein [Aestuariibacter sp.]